MSYLTVAVLALSALIYQCIPGSVTHYGESYRGQQMGCPHATLYRPEEPSIIAVSLDSPFDCGDILVVAGPHGTLTGVVQDKCPGCSEHHIDLSEAGIAIVCGPGAGRCDMTYTRVGHRIYE